ncbi:MAG: phosphomannomutase/phosphoglucomutase [Anaerolineae bacterium]
MNPSIFRAYSIRGVVGRDLDASDVRALGQALGSAVLEAGGHTVVVGHDVRVHSPALAQALVEGLCASGAEVRLLGLVPTPVLNFATDLLGADAGVAVTASHNPPDENGLKVRTDRTLLRSDLLALRARAEGGRLRTGKGRVHREEVRETYLGQVCARVRGVPLGLRTVVDAGNGTNGPWAQALLERLGCQVTLLHGEPDGTFPHRSPNPLDPGSLEALQEAVRAERADLGLAYDGDGDRLVVVDDRAEVVWADRVLALLARQVLAERPGARVVHEVLCTQALADDVRAHGGVPILSPVGYALVHERMREVGAVLAGEMAGHFFFADPQFRFDDALLATARVVETVARAGRPLSHLLADLPAYCTSPERRIPCSDGKKERVVAALARVYRGQRPVDTLDGVRVQFEEGWGLVRASQTQAALSMRFEARTPEALAAIEAEITAHVRALMGGEERA